MLAERMDQWREDAVREGQRRGLAEGQRRGLLEGRRVALAGIAAHRFDAATVAALSEWLADVDDPAQLATAGDLIATCATGQDLLHRLGPARRDS